MQTRTRAGSIFLAIVNDFRLTYYTTTCKIEDSARMDSVLGDEAQYIGYVAYPLDLFEEGSVTNILTSIVGNVFGFLVGVSPHGLLPLLTGNWQLCWALRSMHRWIASFMVLFLVFRFA